MTVFNRSCFIQMKQVAVVSCNQIASSQINSMGAGVNAGTLIKRTGTSFTQDGRLSAHSWHTAHGHFIHHLHHSFHLFKLL